MSARLGPLSALVAACVVVAAAAWADAPPIEVQASVSKGEVTVGEPFVVHLVAHGPDGTAWTFPEKVDGEHVSLRSLPPAKGDEASAGAHSYEAMAFALDDVSVPALEVGYRLADGTSGKIATEPVALRVGSLLAKGGQEDALVDVRPPVRVLPGAPFWIALAVLVGAVALAVLWLLRRRRRSTTPLAEVVSVVPPDVEARAALDALSVDGLSSDEELRAFYIRLTEIAKRYLERRLEAPVLEMTSMEVSGFLRDHPHGAGVLGPVRELSRTADHVKFARGTSREEEARRQLVAVRAVVDGLEARLRDIEARAEQERTA